MDGTKVITVTMRSVPEMESMLMNYLAKLTGGNHLSLMEKLFLIDLNVKRDICNKITTASVFALEF